MGAYSYRATTTSVVENHSSSPKIPFHPSLSTLHLTFSVWQLLVWLSQCFSFLSMSDKCVLVCLFWFWPRMNVDTIFLGLFRFMHNYQQHHFHSWKWLWLGGNLEDYAPYSNTHILLSREDWSEDTCEKVISMHGSRVSLIHPSTRWKEKQNKHMHNSTSLGH